jgi:hypothetical protein
MVIPSITSNMDLANVRLSFFTVGQVVGRHLLRFFGVFSTLNAGP